MDELFTYFNVRLDFLTKLCASVPADQNLIKKWLETRQPRVRPPGGRSIDEMNEEVLASLPQAEEEVSGLIFQRTGENGNRHLTVRTATLRAHMKDCARIISSHYVGKISGERSFFVKIKDCVYHDESQYWTPILRPDGSNVTEADGTKEKPIHVTDARGRPMNALKLFEYIEPARIDFTIKVMNAKIQNKAATGTTQAVYGVKPVVPIKDLETLFLYGGTHGYAGEAIRRRGAIYIHDSTNPRKERNKTTWQQTNS